MLDYWNLYPSLQNRLNTVHQVILDRMKVSNKTIQGALSDFANSGGKMLRPALFLLMSEFGDKNKQEKDQLIKVAASLEMLHMATLIHDDVIDDSPLRRGQITIQSKYGKDVAVYTGDLLFTQFFELVIEIMNGSDFLAINAAAMKGILLGELDQMDATYNQNESIDDYLHNITGKTAELFWLACKEGAHFGCCSASVEQAAEVIGKNIGMAFQIFDDILDYTESDDILQKPALEDLAQGVYTLPLLLARQAAPEKFTPYLNKRQYISEADAKATAKLVVDYGGVEKAKEYAVDFTQKAIKAIEQLPDQKAKHILHHITHSLLSRHS